MERQRETVFLHNWVDGFILGTIVGIVLSYMVIGLWA